MLTLAWQWCLGSQMATALDVGLHMAAVFGKLFHGSRRKCLEVGCQQCLEIG